MNFSFSFFSFHFTIFQTSSIGSADTKMNQKQENAMMSMQDAVYRMLLPSRTLTEC